MILITEIILLVSFNIAFCDNINSKTKIKSARLPFFRRKVEEVDYKIHPPENTEDPNQNLVSILMNNVKEIFGDTYDENEKKQTVSASPKKKEEQEHGNDNTESNVVTAIAYVIQSSTQKEAIDSDIGATSTFHPFPVRNGRLSLLNYKEFIPKLEKNDIILFGNNPAQTIKEPPEFDTSVMLLRPTYSPKPTENLYFLNRPTLFSRFRDMYASKNNDTSLSPHFMNSNEIFDDKDNISSFPFLGRKSFKIVTALDSNTTARGFMFSSLETESPVPRSTVKDDIHIKLRPTRISQLSTIDFDTDNPEVKRSCIRCNNVAVDGCTDPKGKLIPSTVCDSEEDVCYSMHTPFGIVDRGCYNSSHNMSTRVCGSNLCNYIDLMDLPVLFASKQEWIQNMLDLTHFKRLRKSTKQGLVCLNCEGKNTTEGDAVYYKNCKEGNLGAVQEVKCKENEICGTRSINSKGYIWRGCVSSPMYNYYITFCDSDLCNYDPPVSPYDNY